MMKHILTLFFCSLIGGVFAQKMEVVRDTVFPWNDADTRVEQFLTEPDGTQWLTGQQGEFAFATKMDAQGRVLYSVTLDINVNLPESGSSLVPLNEGAMVVITYTDAQYVDLVVLTDDGSINFVKPLKLADQHRGARALKNNLGEIVFFCTLMSGTNEEAVLYEQCIMAMDEELNELNTNRIASNFGAVLKDVTPIDDGYLLYGTSIYEADKTNYNWITMADDGLHQVWTKTVEQPDYIHNAIAIKPHKKGFTTLSSTSKLLAPTRYQITEYSKKGKLVREIEVDARTLKNVTDVFLLENDAMLLVGNDPLDKVQIAIVDWEGETHGTATFKEGSAEFIRQTAAQHLIVTGYLLEEIKLDVWHYNTYQVYLNVND